VVTAAMGWRVAVEARVVDEQQACCPGSTRNRVILLVRHGEDACCRISRANVSVRC
jgi:hypothetical protein